jgi:hypothetical protein
MRTTGHHKHSSSVEYDQDSKQLIDREIDSEDEFWKDISANHCEAVTTFITTFVTTFIAHS